jgi:hypothetical protein
MYTQSFPECCPITVSCCEEPWPRTLLATMDFDWLSGTDYLGVTATLEYVGVVGGNHTWTGPASCNGDDFEVQAWCDEETELPVFDLVKDDVSYGNPALNEPGGATMTSCDPLDIDGLISTSYTSAQFPFCGSTGDNLNQFRISLNAPPP